MAEFKFLVSNSSVVSSNYFRLFVSSRFGFVLNVLYASSDMARYVGIRVSLIILFNNNIRIFIRNLWFHGKCCIESRMTQSFFLALGSQEF